MIFDQVNKTFSRLVAEVQEKIPTAVPFAYDINLRKCKGIYVSDHTITRDEKIPGSYLITDGFIKSREHI